MTDDETTQEMKNVWIIPLALVLTSFSWWECFVVEDSKVAPVRWMYRVREKMIKKTRYFTFIWLSLVKMVVFFFVAWAVVVQNGIISDSSNLFDLFHDSFQVHKFNVSEVKDQILGDPYDEADVYELRYEAFLDTDGNVPLNVLLIQAFCCYGAYIFGKFACKVHIQGFSYSIPLSSVVPACITLLIAGCGARAADVCSLHPAIPDYLFFECPAVGDYFEYLKQEQTWLWIFWFLSQLWITVHIWFPKSTRLASTEQVHNRVGNWNVIIRKYVLFKSDLWEPDVQRPDDRPVAGDEQKA